MGKEYGKKVLETVINMKGSTRTTKNQDMGYSHGLREIFIKGIIKVTKDMDMDKCTGMTVVFIKDLGIEEFSMEKVIFHNYF